jgi:hypothetical protein
MAKRPRDLNQLAKRLTDLATGEADEDPAITPPPQRNGGKAGGRARAKALTPERRSEIARKAAQTRWAKRAQD